MTEVTLQEGFDKPRHVLEIQRDMVAYVCQVYACYHVHSYCMHNVYLISICHVPCHFQLIRNQYIIET